MRKQVIGFIVILGALLRFLLAPLPFGEKTRIQTTIEIAKPAATLFPREAHAMVENRG